MLEDKNKKEDCCSGSEDGIITSYSNEHDRRIRVEKITQILEAVHYKTEEEKADAIVSFARANLSYQEITKLVEPLKAGYKANFDRAGGVF